MHAVASRVQWRLESVSIQFTKLFFFKRFKCQSKAINSLIAAVEATVTVHKIAAEINWKHEKKNRFHFNAKMFHVVTNGADEKSARSVVCPLAVSSQLTRFRAYRSCANVNNNNNCWHQQPTPLSISWEAIVRGLSKKKQLKFLGGFF